MASVANAGRSPSFIHQFWTFSRRSMMAAGCVAMGGSLVAVHADQPDAKAKTNQNAIGREAGAKTDSIPGSIQKLNLTSTQRDQITTIVREYDQSLNTVWDQFRDRYMQTIKLETSMLFAIEDQLTDAQRQKIRDHRRTTARHENSTTVVTAKPVIGDKAVADKTVAKDKPTDEVDVTAGNLGVSLTRDQEASADKVHQSYRSHLRTLNREVRHLHNRLVALEAEKMGEIEKVLTKDQMNQLSTDRQSAPEALHGLNREPHTLGRENNSK